MQGLRSCLVSFISNCLLEVLSIEFPVPRVAPASLSVLARAPCLLQDLKAPDVMLLSERSVLSMV